MAEVEDSGGEVPIMLMTFVVNKGEAGALDVASGDMCVRIDV